MDIGRSCFKNFYPRPPRGGRLLIITPQGCKGRISIHALREEGDIYPLDLTSYYQISIHALREEGDWHDLEDERKALKFLSTPSVRRATIWRRIYHTSVENFYPRPP